MSDPTNSLPYNELEKVLRSFVSSNTNANNNTNNNNKKEVGGSCVKEAEAAAAKARQEHEAAVAMLRQHKASAGESTVSNNNTTTPTQTSSTPTIAIEDSETSAGKEGGEDLLNAPMPQTQEEAMDHINKLQSMKDALLEEQKRNNAFVERYQKTVSKKERMAELHNLIPRELFVREDRYQQELEHVYKWSGISDQEIADIYLAKLKKSGIKQHGASYMPNKDPYQNFRDVPDFSKVNGKPVSSSTNDVLRNLEFMKRISGGGNNGGIN